MSDTPSSVPPLPPWASLGPERLAATLRREADRMGAHFLPAADFCPKILLIAKDDPAGPEKEYFFVVNAPWNEDRDKRGLMRHLGRTVYGKQIFPLAIMLVSEAWLATESPGGPRVEPRHARDRRECLFGIGLSFDGWAVLGKLLVTRDRRNRMVPDGKWDWSEPCLAGVTDKADAESKPAIRPALLRWFYAGFMEGPAAKLGKRLFSDDAYDMPPWAFLTYVLDPETGDLRPES